MYLGRIVETGRRETVWATPLHPYTEALIAAIPRADGAASCRSTLPGEVPDPAQPAARLPLPSALPDRPGQLP